MPGEYKCSKCGKRHYNELTLWNHGFECGNENQQPTCNLCKKTFACANNISKHLKEVHSCSVCGDRFNMNLDLRKHLLRVHKRHGQLSKQTVYSCEFCWLTFNTHGLRLSHTKLMHKKGTAKRASKNGTCFKEFAVNATCPHCNLSLPDKGQLLEHIKTLHSSLCCSDCCIFFENMADRWDHLYSKHSIQLHCAFCLLSFDSEAETQKHEKENHLCDIKRCAVCKEGILQSVSVDHLRDEHGLPVVSVDDVQQCKVCQKFVTKSDYASHVKVEHGLIYETDSGMYVCPQCGVKFRVLGQCKNHVDRYHIPRARVAEVPKQCHICKKVFMKKCNLTTHIKQVHSGRTFLCDQCGAMFKQQNHLTEHLMRHNDYRPYKCNECPNSFVKSYDLKTHMLSHSGTRSVLCSICGATLKSASSLSEHMAKHTGHKPYCCHICGAGFIFPSRLKAHMEQGKHESH